MQVKRLLAGLVIAAGVGISIHSLAASQIPVTDLDLGWYVDNSDKITRPNHTCIISNVWDTTSHWKTCRLCTDKENEERKAQTIQNHVITATGNRLSCSDYGDIAYRESCNCGYVSKKFLLIHGALENYTSPFTKFNYGVTNGTGNLDNTLQITRAIFDSEFGGKTHNGNPYTFGAFRKDAKGNYIIQNGSYQPYVPTEPNDLGWVFVGGPILGGTGIKSSQDIAGISPSKGYSKSGNSIESEEIYMLTRYVNTVGAGSASRSGYITWLRNNTFNNIKSSNHSLNHIYVKWQDSSKVSDSAFRYMVNVVKGYYAGGRHTRRGDSKHYICCKKFEIGDTRPDQNWYHNEPGGGRIFSAGNTYDSSTDTALSYTNGKGGRCDICGATWTGNEEFTDYLAWYSMGAHTAKTGETITTHLDCKVLAYKFDTASNRILFAIEDGLDVTRWRVESSDKSQPDISYLKVKFTLSPGVVLRRNTFPYYNRVYDRVETGYLTHLGGNTYETNALMIFQADNTSHDYWYYPIRTITVRCPGQSVDRYIDLSNNCALTDDDAPILRGNIGVEGNGENADNSSTQAFLNIRFKDEHRYSNNQLMVRLFDSDGRTVIKQFGQEWTPLDKNNSVFTEGGKPYKEYTGKLNIQVEVEAPKTFYVQAKDSVGNLSELYPVTLKYIDTSAPRIVVDQTASLTGTWSTSKQVTATIYDLFETWKSGYGQYPGNVDKSDWVDSGWGTDYSIDRTTGKRIYNFTGDIGPDPVSFMIYVQDAAGNIVQQAVQLAKIDNTAPTITKITKESEVYDDFVTMRVHAHDQATRQPSGVKVEGSGIVGYQVTSTNATPTSWVSVSTGQETCDFNLTSTGTYYFWAKDALGHVSKPMKLEIKHWLENPNQAGESHTYHPTTLIQNRYTQADSVASTESAYKDGDDWNQSYKHRHYGYVRESVTGLASDGSNYNNNVLNIYYQCARYTIKFDGNTNSHGTMANQARRWGRDGDFSKNLFEKKYKYALNTGGGELVGDYLTDASGQPYLFEEWGFKGWRYKQDSPGWLIGQHDYFDPEGSMIKSYPKDLSLVHGGSTTVTAQWEADTIKLPYVHKNSEDFIGWFNKPQPTGGNANLNIDNLVCLGTGGEVITVEGNLRGVYALSERDSNEYYHIYAWYNKRPTFVDVHDGFFFEGQVITWKDLLALIDVFDYEDDYASQAKDALTEYENKVLIKYDEALDDLNDKLYEIEDNESETHDEHAADKVLDKILKLEEDRNEFESAMEAIRQNITDRQLQPVIAQVSYVGVEDKALDEGDIAVDNYTDVLSNNGKDVYDENQFEDPDDPTHDLVDEMYLVKDYSESEYTSNILDTSTNRIGYFWVKYQVHDKGINIVSALRGINKKPGDFMVSLSTGTSGGMIKNSDITIEYSRKCQIDFNYNPMLSLQNMIQYNTDNFGTDLAQWVISRQAVTDNEDTQNNAPWWYSGFGDSVTLIPGMPNQTYKDLQATKIITGVGPFTFDSTFEYLHPEAVQKFLDNYGKRKGDSARGQYEEPDFVNGQEFDTITPNRGNILNEIYSLRNDSGIFWSDGTDTITNNDMWMAIRSIDITLDAKDAWGKYASNKLVSRTDVTLKTDVTPEGYLVEFTTGIEPNTNPGEEYDSQIYQTCEERTVTLMLLDKDSDFETLTSRVQRYVRYISPEHVDTLNSSFWQKQGKPLLEQAFEDKESTPSKDYTGKFKTPLGAEVKINVKDYTE